MFKKPTNDVEALKLAMWLSITAPTEEKANHCIAMAEDFAARLPMQQVERCKREIEQYMRRQRRRDAELN